MTDYWDNTPEEERMDEGAEGTFVFVNGSYVPVQEGSSFFSTVKDVAKNAGLGKFRVFLNGEEIVPEEAPEIIESGDRIELRKYDQAG
jgi:sulfur carrier protein ThiS